ncbi:methionyl-tRNA formyltransferase [Candidatus Saccharibacteria bacterium]|nr:methionyl-tRNA formyltransferase [Candidatus Saccharibacteria bacterium]
MTKPKVIFFGNGPLADNALEILAPNTDIIFHARKKEDLETVKKLKAKNPDAFGILASFGVIIKKDLLDLFDATGGILNIHPSLLPKYRGPSPIETAILNGDKTFGASIMKLAEKMDAGPIYYQTTLNFDHKAPKSEIYEGLAKTAADWLVKNLENLPEPKPQDDAAATYTEKLDTSMSKLKPSEKAADELLNEFRAFTIFPKSRYDFNGIDCIIKAAHASGAAENALSLECKDGRYFCIDRLQPAGKKEMDVKSFINGYMK